MWLTTDQCRLEDLVEFTSTRTDSTQVPYAAGIEREVVIYDAQVLTEAAVDPAKRRHIQAEIAWVLLEGPGVAVFQQAYADTEVVDSVSRVFDDIIKEQHAAGGLAGDHFGKPGENDRIWNALEKFALKAPDLFVAYYANDIIALASSAWLGPSYQITSQVNVVNPGGQAQLVHRDYHLGFQSNEVAEQYPAHAHRLSPVLTLQGAVAHCDMPVESGPTLLLPHSQKYPNGYLAWRLPEFREYFDTHFVQLPLSKGDVVFFNPALFHAAGTNHTTEIRRMANLLQVSSAFGRAMESIDRENVVLAIYDDLRKANVAEGIDPRAIDNVIAASAEGYSFPTNLDRDQPIGGLAPMTQAELVSQALDEDWDHATLMAKLAQAVERTKTH